MNKLSMYFPTDYANNVFEIPYEKLYEQGIRGLIFDIDNTLVHHGEPSTPDIDRLFQRLHDVGFITLLLTNNDEERVKRFTKNIDTLYLCDAGKPDPAGYLQAVAKMKLEKHQVMVIGDQVVTDILGANRSGLSSTLVHYIEQPGEKWIGFKRYFEKFVLVCFRREQKKAAKKKILFCDRNPFFYMLSTKKGILLRHLKNWRDKVPFASKQYRKKMPVLLYSHDAGLIKKGKGIDPVTQYNKADNIDRACRSINGLVLRPGEVFSFWNRVGKTSKWRGYKKGRIIRNGKLEAGYGGGLCNLANTIHVAVLHSPLTVTEFHSHSDALAPDHGKRVPFSAGTSVSYNYIDYRVKNTTDQPYQICVWCADEKLYIELRCMRPLDLEYEIVEENHHFTKKGEDFYRISQIYQIARDKHTGEMVQKTLVLDNKSKVMFDPQLIDKDLIR